MLDPNNRRWYIGGTIGYFFRVGLDRPALFFARGWLRMNELESKLWQIIEPVVSSSGRELVDLSFHREATGWTLRLLVDQPGGIGVDDCAALSREISALLDVEDFFDQRYRLEVSSPGLERPLTRPEHFQRFVGRRIRVRTRAPLEGRREFKGELMAADPQRIVLEVDGKSWEIALEQVKKANLVFEWPAKTDPARNEGE